MNENWKQFLQERGTIHDSSRLTTSQQIRDIDATNPQSVLTDLSFLGLLKVTGNRVEKFLQGQLSCDINLVNEQQTCIGVHCNHKGRIIATVRVLKFNHAFYLCTPREMIAKLKLALNKYAVFSQITLEDKSDEIIQIGLIGHSITPFLLDYFNTVPTKPHDALSQSNLTLILLPGETPRFQIIGTVDEICHLWTLAEKHYAIADSSLWELMDIRINNPLIYPETEALFTPHQINYHLIDGICFTKGCYTGQEIIARMHYLGQSKQQMMYAVLSSQKTPIPGDKLYANQEEVGSIVNASVNNTGSYEVLAVLKNDILTNKQPIHYQQDTGPLLKIIGMH